MYSTLCFIGVVRLHDLTHIFECVEWSTVDHEYVVFCLRFFFPNFSANVYRMYFSYLVSRIMWRNVEYGTYGFVKKNFTINIMNGWNLWKMFQSQKYKIMLWLSVNISNLWSKQMHYYLQCSIANGVNGCWLMLW